MSCSKSNVSQPQNMGNGLFLHPTKRCVQDSSTIVKTEQPTWIWPMQKASQYRGSFAWETRCWLDEKPGPLMHPVKTEDEKDWTKNVNKRERENSHLTLFEEHIYRFIYQAMLDRIAGRREIRKHKYLMSKSSCFSDLAKTRDVPIYLFIPHPVRAS